MDYDKRALEGKLPGNFYPQPFFGPSTLLKLNHFGPPEAWKKKTAYRCLGKAIRNMFKKHMLWIGFSPHPVTVTARKFFISCRASLHLKFSLPRVDLPRRSNIWIQNKGWPGWPGMASNKIERIIRIMEIPSVPTYVYLLDLWGCCLRGILKAVLIHHQGKTWKNERVSKRMCKKKMCDLFNSRVPKSNANIWGGKRCAYTPRKL